MADRRCATTKIALAVALIAMNGAVLASPAQSPGECEFWLAPNGSDDGTGTIDDPWATLAHATEAMPDRGCSLTLREGTYAGAQEIERRFSRTMTVRAETPYRSRLEHDGTVLHLNGATHVSIEGLEITHSRRGASGYVVLIDQARGMPASDISIRNNIIHDSFDNDLLKTHTRSERTEIVGNIFYNQGPREQHLDVNSAVDTVIDRNLFFNDYSASDRKVEETAKHFIVVKDSDGEADGLLGSRNTVISNNVFAQWEGGYEAFIQIGNDGKPYLEAVGVDIYNNVMLGGADDTATTVLWIAGARDVDFRNNTVVGDLPAGTYALWITMKGDNPRNENVRLFNNIWSDPTGTMGSSPESPSSDFSRGDPGAVVGLILKNNLYWNGSVPVPGGVVADPRKDDVNAVFGDPMLPSAEVIGPLPTWDGSSLADGSNSVREAWLSLVKGHARIPTGAAPLLVGDPVNAPLFDIRGSVRGSLPSIGAWDEGVGTRRFRWRRLSPGLRPRWHQSSER